MLAVVEHQQQFLIPQILSQAVGHRPLAAGTGAAVGPLGQGQDPGDGRRQQAGVVDGGQIHEPDALQEGAGQLGGRRQRQPGFADAAGAHHGQDAGGGFHEQGFALFQFGLAADGVGPKKGQRRGGPVPPGQDAVVQPAGRLGRLDPKLGFQDAGAGLELGQRLPFAPAQRQRLHQGAVDGFLQRIDGQRAGPGGNGAFGLAEAAEAVTQPAVGIQGDPLQPFPLQRGPFLEAAGLPQVKPLQKIASIQSQRFRHGRDGFRSGGRIDRRQPVQQLAAVHPQPGPVGHGQRAALDGQKLP